MALSEEVYLKIVLDISYGLVAEEPEDIKYLSRAFLSPDELKDIKNFRDLASKLEDKKVFSEHNLQELKRLLREINRLDLVHMVEETEAKYVLPEQPRNITKVHAESLDKVHLVHKCKLYHVSLSVVCNDIFEQITDAIVVTTFSKSVGKIEVSIGNRALNLAGYRASQEFDEKLGNLESDHIITTPGGNLKCKYIVHIDFPSGSNTLKWWSVLTRNIIKSLQQCEKPLRCVSITIPLLYSNSMKNDSKCADIIVSAVLDYLEHMSSRSSIQEVIFIDAIKQKAACLKETLESRVKERKDAKVYQIPTQLMCEYIYPVTQTRLIVASGDPKKQPANILVNPSADFTVASSGLTARILIEASLPFEVMQKAFNSPGMNLVVTSAGKLPFQYLYHVRGNKENTTTDYTQQRLQIEACTLDSLRRAERHGLKSIVLPMIYNRYTSIGRYQCAHIMLDAIGDFVNKYTPKSVKEIYFYTGYQSDALKLKENLIYLYGRNVNVQSQVPLEVLARGPEAKSAFIDAIQEGSKPIYQTRLMLVGPERVGKTSLTKALTEQEFDATEEVTDGIEASLSCTLSVKHTTNWKPKLPEDTISEARQQYLRAVAEQMAEKQKVQREPPVSQPTKKDEIKALEIVEVPDVTSPDEIEQSFDQMTISQDSPASEGEVNTMASSQGDSASVTTPDVLEEDLQLVIKFLQDKEKQGENEGLEQTLDDLTLSIWDFAGQDLYYITHQVFLVSRAIYIICFNLCHDLHAPAKVGIYKREGGKVIFSEHHMSLLDFIIFWLRSIYSNTTENKSVASQEQLSPPVFIAGTHRESLPGNAEERQALVDEKFAVIKEALRGTPYEDHVVSKYYAIENSLRSPLDQAVVHLREHITKVAKSEHYMGERIPIKWLYFLHEIEQLRNKQTHSINFTEVNELAAKCGVIQEIQLFTMLHFYHDLGNIIYYGERHTPGSALNDIIILNPHWLIYIFRRVITVKNPSEQWAKFRRSWRRLDEKGLLEERLIRHMWHDFLHLLEGLLQLMQKFDLLCVKTHSAEMPAVVGSPEEGNRLFYVPSLLKKQEDEKVCMDKLMKSKSVVILYIDFNGFLPEGLFYRLIVRLVQWSQHKGGYEPRLFYQQANLYVDEDHDMILRILPQKRSCIQVAIMRATSTARDGEVEEDDVEPSPVICKMLLALLEMNLLNLGHTWRMKRIDFDFCILCSACDREENHFHKMKKCLKEKRVPCGIQRMETRQFQRLFGDCTTMQEAPKSTATPVKHQVPVFLRPLIGLYGEILSPILPFDLMTEICVLLDPPHPLSNDWRALASKLGYDHYINYMSMKVSPTMCVLNGWSEKGWSVEDLKKSLVAIERHDVVRLIDKQLPTEE
ncbi:uncharacterized protein LOC117104339 [Anneissia japonica]|uniref:uncharacterized protein LOC117104339 n=1 Tax=Anneissia japonica TaxID=1529436 RepID=UPI00142595CA|nr:uncharacterized protein LOC117104339 [Anneissia japonica]